MCSRLADTAAIRGTACTRPAADHQVVRRRQAQAGRKLLLLVKSVVLLAVAHPTARFQPRCRALLSCASVPCACGLAGHGSPCAASHSLTYAACWPLQAPKPVPVKKLIKIIKKIIKVCLCAWNPVSMYMTDSNAGGSRTSLLQLNFSFVFPFVRSSTSPSPSPRPSPNRCARPCRPARQ